MAEIKNQNVNELWSSNGRFHLTIQSDKNVVLYDGDIPIWASDTYTDDTSDGPYNLILQKDGNLVAYDKHFEPYWSSETCGQGEGPFRLKVQDDGNCVLADSTEQTTWSTNTGRADGEPEVQVAAEAEEQA